MDDRVTTEVSVGITPEIKSALEAVRKFTLVRPSIYGRQAILEKLVREGYLQHPGFNYQNHPEAAE